MTRIIAAAALGLGLLATVAPAAGACAWEHCAGTSVVCAELGCPVFCLPEPVDTPIRLCVL